MLTARSSLISTLLAVAIGCAAMAGAPAASAQAPASASADRVASFCARQATRSHPATRAAQRRQKAVLRRCVVRYRRANRRTRERDTTAPIVAWQTPAAGATVKGRIEGPSCQVAASDDRGIDTVVFRVDGTALNTENESPYNCIFDTTKVADGSHTLTATAYDAAGNSSSKPLTVNVLNATAPAPAPTPAPAPSPAPEASPAPAPSPEPVLSSSHLVVGIDGGYGGWWSEEIEFRKALGAAVTRHEWDPTSEAVNAQDSLVLKAAAEVHTRIHALLGGNQLGDPTHYREWVVAFIRRYGQGGSFWSEHPSLDASQYAITTFELGNEPYFGAMTASDYADAVRPTLEAVKQLGLPAKMIVDSYIYDKDTRWIDTLYQRIPNFNSLFYGFADHPYWYGHDPADRGGNSPFERIDTLRRKMSEHGASSKPIFLTEYGESTANCGSECVSESVQAAHLQKMIEAAVNRTEWKVEMLDVYQLHDWATGSSSREQQFGIMRQNGTAKPAYSIVRNAMQQYRG